MACAANELPKCKYGSMCYRKGADHRKEFWHPKGKAGVNNTLEGATGSALEDEGTNPISLQPTLRKASQTRPVDGKIESTGQGERKLDTHKGQLKGQLKGEKTVTDVRPIIPVIGKADVVLLLLIGVPGSGKSTFCAKLMSAAAQPWTRICQDIISKGKRGTRMQCLKHAEHALAQKHSVVIDRCNIDTGQRTDFLRLAAKLGVEAHGVVLNLPASVCIQRAAKRVGHEGGLNSASAGPVINRSFRGRQFPSLVEGFSRITFCRTDDDIEKAIQQYRELIPAKTLESGIFGADVSKKNNALQPSHGKGSKNPNRSSVQINEDRQVERNKVEPQLPRVLIKGKSEQVEEVSKSDGLLKDALIEDPGASTLAFPSISTADFHFDHERASSVLVDAVSEFLLRTGNSNLRLVLVDLALDSHMLSLVRQKAVGRGLDSHRFLTYVGDITKLRTSGGPECNIIANAANWRLKAGGGGVNAAIYRAAGPELERATKVVAQTLKPGAAIIVDLPASSPLFRKEGVTHVIHVLGPNMNPQRPNCLSDDYTEGCKTLRSVYDNLFQCFSSAAPILKSARPTCSDAGSMPERPAKNAFTVLMQASKRKCEVTDPNPKKGKSRVTEEIVTRTSRGADVTAHLQNLGFDQSSESEVLKLQNHPRPDACEVSTSTVISEDKTDAKEELPEVDKNSHQDIKSGNKWGSWALALYKIVLHPEQHRDAVLQVTDEAVVVHDAYPKAKRHVLVVAKKHGLDTLQDVKKEHLPVLRHLHSLGEAWATSFLKEDPSLVFRLGYHSAPSMRQLHLHVISQDFESSSLKNKKHWNSFTTPFFLDSSNVLDELQRHGELQICVEDADKLLHEYELRCHRCHSVHPNMPRLKKHITTCRQPLANASPSHLISSESLIV